MKKRGFTLVELLAIILLLAVIALITVPMIITLIRNTRKSVFKSNAEQVLSTAKMYYSKNITDDGVIINISDNQVKQLQYINSGSSTNLEDLPNFHIKGKLPERGKITIANDGKIAFDLYSGEFCAYKTEEANTIYILEGDNCNRNVKIPKIEGTVATKDKDKLVVVASGFYEENNVRTEAKIVRYGFKIDSKDWKYTTDSFYVFNGLKAGSSHRIYISCTNEFGVTVEKDLGSKTVGSLDSTTISAPTGWAQSKTVTITYPKGRYTYQYSLDEGNTWLSDGITNGVKTLTYSDESDNGKYVMARILDKTGNVESAKVLKIAGIDTTPPNVPTISACLKTSATNVSSCNGLSAVANNTWKKERVLTIPSATDQHNTGSPITYYFKTTGAEVNNETKGSYKNINSEGTTKIQYKACDAAGNCSSYSDEFIIKQDRTGPVCTTSYAPGSSSSWTNGSVSIKGECSSDAGVGCNKSVVATKEIKAETNGNVSPGDVQDALGNPTTCGGIAVHIDKTEPGCTTSGVRTSGDVPLTTWSNTGVTLTGQCNAKGGSPCSDISKSVIGSNVQVAKVIYQGHTQDLGWLGNVSNGNTAGTTGQGRRLEAVKIAVSIPDISCTVNYKSHISDVGWEKDWKSNGAESGTTGQSKQMEAIQIKLSGTCATYFDIQYRAHVAEEGWQDWVTNAPNDNTYAGTTGQSRQMEALQVRLVPKSNSGYQLVNNTPVKKISPGTVEDSAGNKASCPAVVAAVDDGGKPTLSAITNTSAGITCSAVGVAVTADDTKSGIKNYRISIGNQNSWVDMDTDDPNSFTAKMNQTIFYEACDYAGNCSDSASTQVHIGEFGPNPSCGTISTTSTTCKSVSACGCKTYKKCCTTYSTNNFYYTTTNTNCGVGKGKPIDWSQHRYCGEKLGTVDFTNQNTGIGCCVYKKCIISKRESSCGCEEANTCTKQECLTATDTSNNECCHD